MNILEAINLAPATTFKELIKLAPSKGLYLEFGVYQGESINIIAQQTNNTIFGFDSFEGLPEDWYVHKKGDFKCDLPTNLPDNVRLIKGWYDYSIPEFMKLQKEKVSFIHIDCDLYSSTKTIFDNMFDKLNDQCIIIFDEIYGYEGYEHHEYKAFNEFLERSNYNWECVGKYSINQAGFRIYV